VLQGKFDQALNDSSRLAVNTIAGLGGVIDVATMLDLEKNHEDFGQTFGVWGVPEGPYIVLPVFGPRTMRSAVGTALDTYLQVETLGAVSEAAAGQEIVTEMLALNLIHQRSKMLGKTELLEQAALDPYVFTREAYLAYRRCQVEDCDKVDYQPSATPELFDDGIDELDLLDELEQPQNLPDELDLLDELD
jgi:phospholipid-binding lipoprotein MlaA